MVGEPAGVWELGDLEHVAKPLRAAAVSSHANQASGRSVLPSGRPALWPLLVGSHPPIKLWFHPCCGEWKGMLAGVPEPDQDPQESRLFSSKVCSHPPSRSPQTGSGPRGFSDRFQRRSSPPRGHFGENPKLLERRGT